MSTFTPATDTGYGAGTAINWTTVKSAAPNVYTVSTTADAQAKLDIAVAGDVIELADGTYTNAVLKMTRAGTEAAPIYLTAENPGSHTSRNCTLTNVNIEMTANYCVAGGFRILNSAAELYKVSGANYSRWTDIDFVGCGDSDSEGGSKRVLRFVNGSSWNKVDHCLFSASVSISVMAVWDEPLLSQNNIIEYNEFSDIASTDSAQRIAILLGQDLHETTRRPNVGSNVARYNKFLRNDVISIDSKGSQDRMYRNYVDDCAAGIYIRIGEERICRHNYINNVNKGILIVGNHNRVTNNYINPTGNRGSSGYGISMVKGDEPWTYPKATFMPAYENLIAWNTIAGSLEHAIEIGRDQVSGKGWNHVTLPYDNYIYNNILTGTAGDLIYMRNGAGLAANNNDIDNNLYHPTSTCVDGSGNGDGWIDDSRVDGDPSLTDFRVSDSSNAVDAARTVVYSTPFWGDYNPQFDFDLDANARIQGVGADIGCFESSGKVFIEPADTSTKTFSFQVEATVADILIEAATKSTVGHEFNMAEVVEGIFIDKADGTTKTFTFTVELSEPNPTGDRKIIFRST